MSLSIDYNFLNGIKYLTDRYLNKAMKAPRELLKLACFILFKKSCFIVLSIIALSQRMAPKRDYSVLWQNHYVILNPYTLFKYLISFLFMKEMDLFS